MVTSPRSSIRIAVSDVVAAGGSGSVSSVFELFEHPEMAAKHRSSPVVCIDPFNVLLSFPFEEAKSRPKIRKSEVGSRSTGD